MVAAVLLMMFGKRWRKNSAGTYYRFVNETVALVE